MLDREQDAVAIAVEVGGDVTPGVEIGRATQRLPEAQTAYVVEKFDPENF